MTQMDADNTRDPQTYAIIGACMEVHRILGCGFTEVVYHAAAKIEFRLRNVPFVYEPVLQIHYRGEKLDVIFRADFLCFEDVVVEFKAIPKLGDGELNQMINELAASKIRRGLLINFGAKRLEYNRVVWGGEPGSDPSVSSA